MVIQNIRTAHFTGAAYAGKEQQYGHHIARGVGQKCRIGEKVMIKVGDKVTWESQAQGSWREKTGKVLAIVPAGENVMPKIPTTAKRSHAKISSSVSQYDRALVAVPAGAYGGLTHYYAPRLSALEVTG